MAKVVQGALSFAEVLAVAQGEPVEIDPRAWEAAARSRAVIERILARGDVAYGVNTGFGRLAEVLIPAADLAELQLNLVRSHAVGVGEPLRVEETRAMMFLRANVFAQGYSGARPELMGLLVEMLNRGVHPVVPARGSVGASGDLAPLAHLALAMIGEGACHGPDLRAAGLAPAVLQPKEGLALLNGTQAIGAVGILALARAFRCLHVADVAGAMSLEALLGTPAAMDPRIQAARGQTGQSETATRIVELMRGSQIRESHRTGDQRVQDAYCLRCMPQVHGAVRHALTHAREIFEIETAAGTDNPLVFAEAGDVVSGGNFHAAPLGYALDYAAIALTDLLSISERRMDRLVNPDSSEGLPPFLTRQPGLGSGYMMAHVTVAALLSECKVLAHPASVDSVPTSGGKEDHVSMGMTAALKFRQIVANVERGLAIELLAACDGIDFRLPLRPGPRLAEIHDQVRALAPPLEKDRSLSPDIERIAQAIAAGTFDLGWEA